MCVCVFRNISLVNELLDANFLPEHLPRRWIWRTMWRAPRRLAARISRPSVKKLASRKWKWGCLCETSKRREWMGMIHFI